MNDSVLHIVALLLSGFTDWSSLGNISVRQRGDLCLFTYTQEAQYRGEWNSYERVCRGLIINSHTGEIVARPFDKFFNWLERGYKAYGYIVNVTEKIDGSLGILYWDKGYKVATRGSFDGEQAVWATNFIQNYDLEDLDPELTLLFEIIYPENRVVVDYGDREDLVLLAARNRFSGEYLPFYPDLIELSEQFGFSLPKVYSFNSVSDILAATGIIGSNQEGWVAEFSDGSRWKFKGDRYLELHKLINGLSFKRVLEWCQLGEYHNRVKDIPEEFIGQVEECFDLITNTYQDFLQKSLELYEKAPKSTRKEFALWVRNQEMQSVLFALYDQKDLAPSLWKIVRETLL